MWYTYYPLLTAIIRRLGLQTICLTLSVKILNSLVSLHKHYTWEQHNIKYYDLCNLNPADLFYILVVKI